MTNEEERVAHLAWRWATSFRPHHPSSRRKPESSSSPRRLYVCPQVGVQAHWTSSPSVIPAKAGIHVASPASVCMPASWRTGTLDVIPFRHSGESRNPRRLPGVCMYARELAYRHTGRHPLPSFRRKPESTSPPRCLVKQTVQADMFDGLAWMGFSYPKSCP